MKDGHTYDLCVLCVTFQYYVVQLNVSVDYILAVHVVQRLRYLAYVTLTLVLRQSSSRKDKRFAYKCLISLNARSNDHDPVVF